MGIDSTGHDSSWDHEEEWEESWEYEEDWSESWEEEPWSWTGEQAQSGEELNYMAKGKKTMELLGQRRRKGQRQRKREKAKEKERTKEKARAKQVKSTKEKEPKDHRGGKRQGSATTVKDGVTSLEIVLTPQKTRAKAKERSMKYRCQAQERSCHWVTALQRSLEKSVWNRLQYLQDQSTT